MTGRALFQHPAAVLSFLLLAAGGCSGPTAPAMRSAVPVTIATVTQKSVPLQVRIIGSVQAHSSVSVKTLVSGELTAVHFEEGQEVKQGDLLFEIDPRPFQTAIKQAEGAIARETALAKQAEANLARDKFQAVNAEADARRYADLVKQGIVAQEQYDRFRSTADALNASVNADKAAIENAEASLRSARAALENAKLQLDYCSIRSPIDGRTGSLQVNRGNVVKLNETVLLVINQIRPIYVNFAIPEQYIPEVKKYMAQGNLKAQALIPTEEKRPEEGTLTFVDNSVETTTGTIRLRGTFANPEKRLWPGQFVNVVLTLSSQPNALVVPAQAVQTGQTGSYVFVVKSDLTAESRPVVVTRTVDGEAVVEKGLAVGEKVVTDGQLRLIPGSKVEVQGPVGQAFRPAFGKVAPMEDLGRPEGLPHKARS